MMHVYPLLNAGKLGEDYGVIFFSTVKKCLILACDARSVSFS